MRGRSIELLVSDEVGDWDDDHQPLLDPIPLSRKYDDENGNNTGVYPPFFSTRPPPPGTMRGGMALAVASLVLLVILMLLAAAWFDRSPPLAASPRLLPFASVALSDWSPPWLLHSFSPPSLFTDSHRRGHVAILYSGTIRSFSATFHSHLVNLLAPCPYTPHIFMHASISSDNQLGGMKHSDGVNDLLSLNATLDYWAEYDNVDGERVNVLRDVVHFIRLEDDLEGNLTRSRYAAEFAFLGEAAMAVQKPHPIFPIGALESLRQANEASEQYARDAAVEYQWVVRIRYDTSLKSNVWDGVFDIQPRSHSSPTAAGNNTAAAATAVPSGSTSGVWEADGHSTYVLHDTVWTSRLSCNNTVLVPPCDEFFGWNDQFALGSPAAMAVYANRAHELELMNRTRAVEPKWNFHAESWLARTLRAHSIHVSTVPLCYSILYMTLGTGDAYQRSRRTSCRWAYGNDCCKSVCPAKQRSHAAWRELFQPYSSHVEYANSRAARWDRGSSSSSSDISNSSNWWHYYVTAEENSIACVLADWTDHFDPYAFATLPFIHPHGDIAQHYLRYRACVSGL